MRRSIEKYLIRTNQKSLSINTIIFDMDGVLIDSMPNHAYAWGESMRLHGVHFYEEDAYIHEGRSGKSTIQTIIDREYGRPATKEEIESIYQMKKSIFEKLPAPCIMCGALDFISTISMSGLKGVVVTGSKQPSSLTYIKESFNGFFRDNTIISGNDVKIGKPDPEPYLMALKKNNLKISEAVVVENAPLGVFSAKAAGLYVIAVNTGPLSNAVLYDSGADFVFSSLDELNAKWNELFCLLNFTRI